MPLLQNVFGGNVVGKKTIAFGTPIIAIAPAHRQGRTRVHGYQYTPGNTSHTLTAMRPLARTRLSANAAASQAVVNLLADPGAAISNNIAANDYIVIRYDDGTFSFHKVSSVSGLAITLTTNVTKAVGAGADVWFYGITTDTDPANGIAHPAFSLPTGSTTTLGGDDAADLVVASHEEDQPVLMYSDNITADGTLVYMKYCYTRN